MPIWDALIALGIGAAALLASSIASALTARHIERRYEAEGDPAAPIGQEPEDMGALALYSMDRFEVLALLGTRPLIVIINIESTSDVVIATAAGGVASLLLLWVLSKIDASSSPIDYVAWSQVHWPKTKTSLRTSHALGAALSKVDLLVAGIITTDVAMILT